MAKTKISEYSSTPSNNTDVNGINIAEGCAPSGINNAIRQLMSDLKNQQTGASGDPFTVGGNLTVTGTTSLSTALPVTSGGTGLSALTAGDIPYANTTNSFARLTGAGTTGSVLLSGTVAPSWGKVPLTTHVTGTLPVANGGTGATTSTGTGAVVLGTSPTIDTPTISSPTLTGTPVAPTATAGTNTTQVATTAFVTAAVTASSSGLSKPAATGIVAMTSTTTGATSGRTITNGNGLSVTNGDGVAGNPTIALGTPGTISTSSSNSVSATSHTHSLNTSGLVLTTAFTGNQSLSSNGYQKLPGGLVIQWGYQAITGTTTTVTFPTAFSTACYSVVATAYALNDTGGIDFTVGVKTQPTTTSVALTTSTNHDGVYWLAIGS